MNPHLSLDPVSDVHQLLVFPFMVNALEAGTIVALTAAVAGWFMVLRRQSFAGHTLAVLSFPGAGAAALAGVPLAAGYFTSCAVAGLAIAGGRRDRSGESALVGTVQVAGFALGFLFLSLYHGILESLDTVLFGSFLGITHDEVLIQLAVGAATVVFFAFAGRPLLYATVDPAAAEARGVPVRLLDAAFLVVLGLSVAATAQITGVLLVFALLAAPAAAAQQLTARTWLGLILTAAIGLAVTWLGLGISYFTDYPVGFLVTSLAFGIYLASVLWRRLS